MNSYQQQQRLRRLQLNLPPAEKVLLPADAALATGSHSLAQWMAAKYNHNFDEYDKAIDAVYNETHIGGSQYHHLLDGQHSLWGAYRAVRDVRTDDSFVTELAQAGEHLLRDAASVSGVNPFFSLDSNSFDRLAAAAAPFGMSKPFLADALTVNGPELLGGSVALAASLMMGNNADYGRLSRLSGAYLVTSLVTASPLLLPVAAGGLFASLRGAEDKAQAMRQAGKGAIVSGSALMASSLVGGPVWLGCLAAVGAAVAVQHLLDRPDKAYERMRSLLEPASHLARSVSLRLVDGGAAR
ncbi:hypothetical protein [Paenibacillus sp.]|uniref:hypothetical protein n=1 Tax=Paenibacillus sp. TaxID=58172 RepID=UPI002811D304|nr:hypothetical protein [Paenibacillus sp.]